MNHVSEIASKEVEEIMAEMRKDNTNMKWSSMPFKYMKLNLFCLSYLITWSLLPIFSVMTNSGIFRYSFGVMVALWFITAVINLPKKYVSIVIISMSSFLFIMFLYLVIGFGDLNLFDFVNYLLLFASGVNGYLYFFSGNKAVLKYITVISLLLVGVTTLTTNFALFTNAGVSRMLTSSSTDQAITLALRRANVGAFDFIYGLVILLPVFIEMLRNKNSYIKIDGIVFLVISIVCIVKSNFTMALLLTIVTVVLSLVLHRRKNWMITVILCIVAVLITPYLLKLLLEYVYSIQTSILAKDKINGILLFLNGSGKISSVTDRTELMQISLKSFIESPIWGNGGYYRVTNTGIIGKHSQFIDDFARYGILGGIPLTQYVFSTIKRLKGDRQKNITDCFSISTIVFLMLGFLNPIYNYGILMCYFISASCIRQFLSICNEA